MDVSERLKRNWDRLHVEEGNRSPSADDNSVSARLDRNRERYQRRKTEEEFQTRMNRYANRYASDLNASASSLSNPEYQSREDMDQNVVDALIRRQEQKTASSELYRLAHEMAQDDSAQAVSGLKNYLDDTDAVYKAALDTAKYQRKNWANVYGDFSGKEEYDAVREASTYQQKYGKMTDDELASVVSGMEKNKALSTGERAWLTSYIGGDDRQDAAYRVYEINQGKIADLDKQISALEERLKSTDPSNGKVYVPSSDLILVPNVDHNVNPEFEELSKELENLRHQKSTLETQNTIYERNGLKQYQYGQLRKNEDYEANRDNRTVNPTVEDFDPYYAAKRADYEWIENPGITPDPSARQQLPAKPEIQDRLGFWETYKDDPSLLGTDQTSGKIESNNEAREDYNVIRDGWDRHWDLLTEDEIGTYYYLYNTRGKEEAEKYLDDFQSVLNRRNIENADKYMEEHFEDMSTLEQIVGTAAGVMVNATLSPLAFTDSVARTIKGEDVDPYSNAYSFQRSVAKMRELQSASIEEWTGGKSFLGLKLSDVYGSLLSFADSRAMQAIYGKAATVFMGMSAASSRAAELYDQGASNDDLVMGSLLAGVAEAAFEYISLEKFADIWKNRTKKKGWKKKLLEWLMAAGAEGSEEVNTDLANLLTDAAIRKDQSDFMRKVYDYIDQGKSESEAFGLVWGEQGLEIWKSFAGGAISGGLGAGLALAVGDAENAYYNRIAQENIGAQVQERGNTQDMLNEAMNSDDARIRKLAQDVVDAQNKGKDSRTNRKIGKLYQANEQKAIDALNEASDKGKQKKATRAAFEKAARDYFTEKGTQNVDNAVKLFTAAAFDGLSTKQRGEFNNLGGGKVLSSLVNQANQEVGQQTREQKGKALASRAKNMLNLTVDRAGALEQTAKKAANFSRESVRMLETIIDGDNMVSSNGKTTLASTGERVEISRIASLDKAGKMTFSLSDGRTVDSSDIRYANRAQALIYESMRAVGYAPQTASNLAGIAQSTVRPDLPASRVVLGLQKAYEYGWGHVAEGSRQSEYFAALPQEARDLAMEFGQEAREAYDAELREKQQKKAAAKAQEEQKKASVRFEGGVTEENAGERVKAARDALALVAEKSGVSFVITDEISNRENGHYDPKTNTIYLSPVAGKSGQRTILWTASHELVHAVKEAGVDDFNLLADTLMEAYGKKGVNIDALVAIEQEKAARAGAELSFQDAYEEVVAQAMQDFLTDSEQGFFRTMQNLEAKKPGIGEILLEAIQKILQRIAGIYNGMKPTDAAYAYVGRMNEELGRMYEIMTRALTGETAVSQQSTKADTKKAASKEGGVKAQIREIVDVDGNSFGKGVYLDSTLLSGLSEAERKKMVTLYVKEMGGTVFEARRTDGTIVPVKIAEPDLKFMNDKGKKTYVNRDLSSKFTNRSVKQEAIALVDELVTTSSFSKEEKARHPHGWLDNDGKNRWERWTTYLQDKNNTVWEASLRIATAEDGTKYLYDIDPINEIKKMRGPGIGRNSSDNSLSTSSENVKPFSEKNSGKSQYKQNLLALHNLSEEKLLKALDLGGFPMPSIAVTKNNIPHTNFGDITLVMDPSTVNPKVDSRNTVYSADAWTPTFPGIDYEASPETVKRVKDKYYELARKLGYDRARPLYSYAQDLSEQLTKAGGEQSLMDSLAQDTDLMNLFLADSGQEPVALQQKELRTRLKDSEIELYDSLIQSLGEKVLREMKGSGKESPFTARRRWLEQHKDELRQAYADYYRGNGISGSEIESLLNAQTDQERLREAVRARNYLENGPETVKTEPDPQATERLIREKTDGKAYQKWLSALFAGAEKSKGVYNNKDPFKQNGDRRSFSETHWPVTLDNIAKAMAGQNGGNTKNVAGFYGVKTLRAGMAERFSSIEDMHRLESRLQNLTQEESEAIQNALSDRLEEVIGEIVREAPDWIQKEFFPGNSIGLVLEELAEEGNYTVEAIKRKFNGEYQYRIGEDTAESIRELLFDIREMPVNLFEAKPERSVRFDEVRAAVLPSDSSKQLKDRLQKAGVELLEYERGNTEQRMEQINSIENVKFQYMNADPLEQNVKKILEMSDQEARKRKADDEYILVSETTPQIILDKVEGAPNHKIIIRFDAAYLSMRSSGALPGNYHGYGKNFANTLMEILSDPDAIIQHGNGRINLFGRIQSGNGAQNLVSVELNVIKDIDRKNRPYNLVVTVFPAKENYIRNLIQREGVTVKYEKETLPQVNHQLHEWLATVNGKISSNAIVAQKNETRQEEKSQYRDYTSINERRALVAALEASAQTDSEKMALTEYRRNLGYLEQQEQKLVQLRREIRELSFAKGKRDMAQIQSLREEAMLTSNRIDTADKALLRGEKMAPIKRLLQSETAKAALAERQRAAAALRAEKRAASKEQRELADRYRERMHKNVEGRKMTETKNKIKRAVSDLRSLMNAGKDRANVKIELRPAVQQALDTADVLFSNMSDAEVFRAGIHPVGEIEINAAKRYGEFLDRVERMQRELEALPEGSEAYKEKAKNLETNRQSLRRNGKILQQAFIRERAALNALPVSSAIQALADAYKDLGESKSPHVAAAYDSTVYEKLLSIKTDLGGTTVQNMSLAQLESVYDAYKLIREMVRKANRAWVKGKWEDVQANGNAVVREEQEVRPQRDSRASAVGRMNTIVLNELKPYYFFEAVGSPTLSRFYDSLRAGEDTFARDVYETQSFLDDVFEQTKAKKWDMDKTFSITLEEGRTVQLSLGEMLSIYAYSKREQALKHMSEGGFMRPGTQVKTGDDVKGKIRDALLPSEDTGRKAFRVKEADVGKIVEALNKADKNYIVYADRMQKFLSEVMGAKGNEASRALYDIDLFKEQYYFPLQSSKDFMASAATPPGESSLRNSGMTKETTPGAKNPIILQSFNDVWASHVNKMSLYHAFVLPIDAMNKLLNYTDFYQSGEPVSVKTALNASWGRGAYEYIHQLLVDLNGGVTVPGAKSPIGALIGRFKKTAVAANLSVMVQQPTAILRAMTVIDPSSFIPLTGLSHKAKWEQLKKYAPVAVLKEMGGFDVGSGRQLQQYLFGDSSLMAKIDDFTMKGAAFGDEIGWNMIWDAAKRQIHRETGLSYDSEDLLQQAGKLFTKAVHQTQVYDSVLSRSGYMRSQSDLVKMSTSFMAEPTTTVNMLYNAVLQLKRGKMSFQQASRTVAFTFLAAIAAAVAQSFVTAARDKDEDKTYYEKLMGDLVGNALSNTFIPGMLPVLRDVVSLLEGWDVERTDMALVNDLIAAVKTATSDKKSTYDKVEAISGAFANFFGIPLRNIMRDGRAFYNVVRAFFSDTPTTGQGIKESIQSEIPFFGHDASNAESLYNAYVSGDRVMRDRVIGRYKDEEAARTALKSEIRRRYLKGQLDRETALRNLQEFVGENEDEAYWSLDRWDYAKAEGTAEGYDRYEDLHNVIPQGTGTKAVLQTYLDNGVSRQALAAEITRYFKPLYRDMSPTERSNIRGKLLNAYEALGYSRTKKLSEIISWGSEESDYADLFKTIQRGTGTKQALQDYLDKGTPKSTLADKITDYFKPKYQAMGETERSNIRGKLLNAYEALGYNRQKKLEEIVAWGKEKKE